jgi:hypothetical protein
MQVSAAARSRVLKASLGSPALGTTTVVHAAVTDDGTEQTITAAITDPDIPRVVSATAGGTANDIKAIQVTINGTNAFGETITEDLPVFTVNTAGTKIGSKAFATVTSIVIPAHDGTSATTAVGVGDIIGIGLELSRDTIVNAFFGGALEGTRPTVAFHATNLEANTVDLNTALDGSAVILDYYRP